MVKNHKLAKAIQSASWSEFVRQLQYKSDWNGKNLIKCDRFAPSSKTCNECGSIKDDLKLSDRTWLCPCGAKLDRDLNASKNIIDFAFGKIYPEDTGNSKSVERMDRNYISSESVLMKQKAFA
jgi:putative transposase